MLHYKVKEILQMTPQVFGWEHLTYLAIFIVVSVASLVCIKLFAKNEKTQDIIVRSIGALLLVTLVWNRISIAVTRGNAWLLIPDSFCGMSSLVLALAVLIGKRNNNVLHFVVHVAFVGTILTVVYPDFIDQDSSFLFPSTLSGLLHHSISLYLCILLYMTGWFVADWHKWPNLVIGFMAYITLGAFLISVLDYSSAFYITEPILDGTPLTVWVIAPIFAVGYAIFMVIYEVVKRKIRKKKEALAPTSKDNQGQQ